MKRLKVLFYSFSMIALLMLTSCGADNSLGKSSNSSSLSGGKQCACDSSYMPVCGYNNVTYDNLCIAKCYVGEEANQFAQGRCSCSLSGPVCGDNNETFESECDAQAAIRNGRIKRIVKYADCNAATL